MTERPRRVWMITAAQLARGYWRRAADGRVTGPFPFVVRAKLEVGVFEVEAPPDDALETAP